jgi:hypothetical protein
MSSRRAKIITISVASLGLWFVWSNFLNKPSSSTIPVQKNTDTIPAGIVTTEITSPSSSAEQTPQCPGDLALQGYSNPATSAKIDLTLLANSITNFLIISKRANERPLSANEEWSAALRGKRDGGEVWLSDSSPVLDSQKRLIDRWKTPLSFHALGGKRWEIRSAGPDKQLWTDDDLVTQIAG